MASHTPQKISSAFLSQFSRVIKSFPFARQIVSRWMKDHDVRILSGAGAGLLFKIANTTSSYINGDNELPVQEVLTKKLKPGSVFYDIGANVGFFSVIAARLVGSTGQVVAFEPVPENVSAIKHNASINKFSNIQVVEAAVSNTTGKGEIFLANWRGGAALATTAAPPPDVKGSMMIDLLTIDDLLEQAKIPPPTCIKIDVEGAEIDVLQGMGKTLQTYHPVIIYEVDDGDRAVFSHKQALCRAFLESYKYRIMPLEASYSSTEWIVGHYIAE